MRAAEFYLKTDTPLSQHVICRLIETLIEHYELSQRYVINQLKSQLDKEGIQAKIPSQSTYSIYLKKQITYTKKSMIKASNLKLEISDNDVKKVKPIDFKKKIVLFFDVKDKVLPPWYMRGHNKKAIIKLESLLNKNPNQNDEFVKSMVDTIKQCSPEDEHEKIKNSIEWYRKNINNFTKQSEETDTNRPPFTADLITFDRDTEESKITTNIFIKFQDYLGYLPFTVDVLEDFLDQPDDSYQLFVNKNGYEYELSLEITNPLIKTKVKYSVTLAIYENPEPKFFGKMPDLVSKKIRNKTYTLTANKSVASSIIKLDSKNGHTDKQLKKTMDIIDKKFSLYAPDQWIIEAIECEGEDKIKINNYQNNINAIDNIQTIKKYSEIRPELSSTVDKTYIIKLI